MGRQPVAFLIIFLFALSVFGDSYTPAKESTLSAMSAKIPATLGQKTKANSMSCTKASDEDATAVTGTFWQTTQPVSGTVTCSGPLTDTQLRASAVSVSLAAETTKVIGTVNISGSQTIGLAAGSQVVGHIIADSGSTTAVTGTVTVGTHAVTVASGGIASGALAAGSVASGAIASGAVASGAIASGAVASGALASGSIAEGAVTAGPTSFVKVEDVASANADAGVAAMAIQQSSPADTAGTNGDYAMLQMSAGRLWTSSKIDTALPAGTAVIGHVITDTNSTTAVTGTVTTSEATTGGNPCQNPQSTLVSITGATSTTNATQIVALSGTTKVYICSLTVIGVSGTTPTFSLVYGTGSNCATNQTVLVQAWTTGAGTLYQFATPVGVNGAGTEICYKDTGTNPVQNYQITYVQQ